METKKQQLKNERKSVAERRTTLDAPLQGVQASVRPARGHPVSLLD